MCGCDVRHKTAPPEPWKWGGCSADVEFGMRYTRKFTDARELERDARTLMNLHNNRVGRTVRMQNLYKNTNKVLTFDSLPIWAAAHQEAAAHGLQVPWRQRLLRDENLLEELAAISPGRRQANAEISQSQNCSSRQRQTWTEISIKQVSENPSR